jgi:hypothetical protein
MNELYRDNKDNNKVTPFFLYLFTYPIANEFSKFTHNFFETSAKIGINCDEIFYEIVRQIDTLEAMRKRDPSKKKRKSKKCIIM